MFSLMRVLEQYCNGRRQEANQNHTGVFFLKEISAIVSVAGADLSSATRCQAFVPDRLGGLVWLA